MIDLAPHHLETVRRILKEYVPACEVRAFGSRVDWTAKDYSDLDLAVMGSGKLKPGLLGRLTEAFEECDLPFRVDVLDWHATSPEFQKVIEKQYEVIQGAKGNNPAGKWPTATVGAMVSPARNALVGGPFGSNLVSADYADHGIPVIRGQNMGGRWVGGEFAYVTPEKAASLEANLARPGDIVITQRGTLGQVSIVPAEPFERYLISQSQMKLTVDRNLASPLFIYYVFRTPAQQEYIRLHSIQTGVPHTNLGILRDTPVPLPPMREQTAISQILGTLDDKIELNRRMNETLEAMARALFKSWFVDFDPVRAKAAGRDPGLPKHLADLFPDSFEGSALGEIPKGWSVGSFLESAKLLSGGTPKTEREDYWGGDILWASAKDVSRCSEPFIVTTERTITQKGLAESATQLIPSFCTVVVARGATTGRMALLGREMAMNQTCYALESLTGTPFVLYCQLRHEIERLVHGAHGSVFDTVTTSTFASSTNLLPPKQVLGHLETLIAPLLMRVLSNVRESRTLAALRDTLLPKLISGELRIRPSKGMRGGLYECT